MMSKEKLPSFKAVGPTEWGHKYHKFTKNKTLIKCVLLVQIETGEPIMAQARELICKSPEVKPLEVSPGTLGLGVKGEKMK